MRAVTIIEARAQENNEKIIILDVRVPQSYDEYHVKNAVNIPYEKIEYGNYFLPDEYGYLIYCEHGTQSMLIGRILEAEKYFAMPVIGGMAAY